MLKNILIIGCVISLTGCSWYPFYDVCSEYEIVEVSSSASCVNYELQDADSNKISLPVEIEEAFECPLFLERSNDFKYLLYVDGVDLNLYNFSDKKINYLYSFSDGFEGASCKWSPSDLKIACVSVDQEGYESLTKITVMDLKKGELIGVEDYYETVDFVCGASCYPGEFWFESDDVLKYEGHNILEDPQEIHEIQL